MTLDRCASIPSASVRVVGTPAGSSSETAARFSVCGEAMGQACRDSCETLWDSQRGVSSSACWDHQEQQHHPLRAEHAIRAAYQLVVATASQAAAIACATASQTAAIACPTASQTAAIECATASQTAVIARPTASQTAVHAACQTAKTISTLRSSQRCLRM